MDMMGLWVMFLIAYWLISPERFGSKIAVTYNAYKVKLEAINNKRDIK